MGKRDEELQKEDVEWRTFEMDHKGLFSFTCFKFNGNFRTSIF